VASHWLESASWLPKAVAQKAIGKFGLLPLYHGAQHVGGRLRHFHARSRVEYAAKLYSDLQGHASVDGAAMLEIGTGWVPVVPLALSLLGAKSIVSFDVSRHLQERLTLKAVKQLRDCIPEIARRTGVGECRLRERQAELERATTIDDLFARAGITYLAPADASRSRIADASVDIVYSNLVLEHVPPAALCAIHAESRRVLKPAGACWHNVDFSDHYAATNDRLSKLNFLRYGARFWEAVGQNDILYQNRLRSAQHCRLFERAGFTAVHVVRHQSDELLRSLAQGLPIHPDFLRFGAPDLSLVSARYVLKHVCTPAATAPELGALRYH
jgi:hypothetical protein